MGWLEEIDENAMDFHHKEIEKDEIEIEELEDTLSNIEQRQEDFLKTKRGLFKVQR